MTAETLRDRLNAIKQQDYAPPEDMSELTTAMLTHLGHPDGELRDELIYLTFVHWIQRGVYAPEELRTLLDTVSDNAHLFMGLGEVEGDSVFTRAFSVLLVPPILARHRQKPFFSTPELAQLQNTLITYLKQERDLRGFVVGKGLAHSADALAALAACRELDAKALYELLELTRDTASTMQLHFTHGEDERLSRAALQGLSQGILEEREVRTWLGSFRGRAEYVGTHPLPEGYWGFSISSTFCGRSIFPSRLHQNSRTES